MICPFATYRPIASHGGVMSGHIGLVEHVTTNDFSPYGFFSNPANSASSHFWIAADGTIEQYIDSGSASWAQAGGNANWLSVEVSGKVGTLKTGAQIEALARLLAWAHQVHGIPIQASDDVARAGLGWHGMGGWAWGGHLDCPGAQRVAQRPQVLARATVLAGAPGTPPPPPPLAYPQFPGRLLTIGLSGGDVRTWQAQMAKRGWTISVDGSYGPASAQVCRSFQQEKGLAVDGIVGKATWAMAFIAPVT